MSSQPHFSLRDATLAQDEAFIVSTFDASISYLTSIGSQAQWGTTPFLSRPGWLAETSSQIVESEQNSASNITDALRIAEAVAVRYADEGGDGTPRVAVGFVFVRGNWLPKYLPAAAVSQVGNLYLENSLYVEVMVSDSRLRDQFHGIGAAMLRGVREWGRSRGKKVLFLDGWAGNERKLIRSVNLQLVAKH
jgi:hypothetical protein